MDQWYYAKSGQQTGPISLEALRGLIKDGTIDPAKDLVWNPGMTDWLQASSVPVLVGGLASPAAHSLEPTHPFAYPLATGAIEEITPGSEPLIPTACVKRAWDLTVKHIAPLLVSLLIFIAVSVAISFVFTLGTLAAGVHPTLSGEAGASANRMSGAHLGITIASNLVSNIVSVFFMLGMTRICLNIVSGRPASVGMVFSQGDKLVRTFFAGILYALMVGIGLLLLIVPGIYLALRYGQYMNAIVDRNMGIMDAFAYSSRITANNRMNLFVISIFVFGISIAGFVACFVGLLFAYPMILVLWTVTYRWLQYGGRAVLDDPASGQPLLAAAPEYSRPL